MIIIIIGVKWNMSKKFIVTIEETVSDEFEIEADNREEALKLAEEGYYKGDYVLCPGNVEYKQISVQDNNECGDWYEL